MKYFRGRAKWLAYSIHREMTKFVIFFFICCAVALPKNSVYSYHWPEKFAVPSSSENISNSSNNYIPF